MSIRVERLDEAKTIIFHIEGKWSASDLMELSERCNRMLDEMSYRADLIGVFTHAQIPSGNLLTGSRGTLRGAHPNRGLIVLVGLNPFFRAMLNILHTVYPRGLERLETVSTLEEAQALITRSRDQPEAQS